MPTAIRLSLEGNELAAELNDGETARSLIRRLPLEFEMTRWGDEYYGSIGAKLDASPAADARDEMALGEIAFWLPGNALCLFFGPTPASVGTEPRAASEVNPVGHIRGDVGVLKSLGGSVTLRVELE